MAELEVEPEALGRLDEEVDLAGRRVERVGVEGEAQVGPEAGGGVGARHRLNLPRPLLPDGPSWARHANMCS